MGIFGKKPFSLFQEGMRLSKSNEIEEAIKVFEEIVKTENPYTSKAYWNLGVCFLGLENYKLALKNYKEFYKRNPEEFLPLNEKFIAALEKASILPKEQADIHMEEFGEKALKSQNILSLGNKEINLNSILEQVDALLYSDGFFNRMPFNKIMANESARIPIKIYSIVALQKTDPQDAFGFCLSYISTGIALALVLFEADGFGNVTIKDPPYSESSSEKDLERRSPWAWPFVATAMGILVDIMGNEFFQKNPWAGEVIVTVKENIIKFYLHEGFSIALESFGL